MLSSSRMPLVLLLFLLPLRAESLDPLETLHKDHPRLIARDADIARIRSLIPRDPLARSLYDRLLEEAATIETAEPVEYKLIGPRLLQQSRRCLDRVYTLALLWRLDGARRYRDRAVRELRAAAGFPDWNPSHFLDTAEMTHAFAIGYDWLYPSLSADERAWIREALVKKGFDAALPFYQQRRSWVLARHNWNQVCNGGIGIGALAVADEEPEKSREVLRGAFRSLPLAMASYAPDGGWAEGPGYWHYATRYNVYFLAALETALGTAFTLPEMLGFDRAGHFRVYFAGPTNRTFNYADAGDSVGTAPEMFWLARKFNEPVYSWHERRQVERSRRADPLDLVWLETAERSPREARWPLDEVYRGVNVAFLRSAWEDPNAIFVGVKGGDNRANHSQLDLGTFVLDANGVRWATDLGPDGYNLPQYFGKLRWTYYRLRTESHNTVLIDQENQDPKAEARITDFQSSPDLARVTIDLTQAYAPKLTSHRRTVELVKRREVVIRDQIEAAQPVEALWGMVTEAEVALEGRRARLTKDGRTVSAEIRSPAEARFDIVSTRPPAPQHQNDGTRKLVVRLPDKVTRLDLAVALVP